jgi:hypothetical protein
MQLVIGRNIEMNKIDFDSPAVVGHVQLMQGIINRMGSNSSNCKTWCVTLVSAIVLFVVDKNKAGHVWLAIVPIIFFAALDSYYLGLEWSFRTSYNSFIADLHAGRLQSSDIFVVRKLKGVFGYAIASLWSFSVLPFYTILLAVVGFAWYLVKNVT